MRLEYPETRSDSKAEELVSHVKNYIHTVAELFKLKAIDKLATGLSSVAVRLVLLMLFTWVIVLASIGLSLWISEQMGDRFSGFFIMAGFYLVVTFLVYLVKDKLIRKSVTNSIVDHLTNDQE
jgi:hypothetical protein